MEVPERPFTSRAWFIDLDGTIFAQQGYERGEDVLLPGVREFWAKHIDPDDPVLFSPLRQWTAPDSTIGDSLTINGKTFYLYREPRPSREKETP